MSKLNVGQGYHIQVLYLSKREIKERLGYFTRGCWHPGVWHKNKGFVGTIVLYKGLSNKQKHLVYWHELIHAINDLWAWDNQSMRGKS